VAERERALAAWAESRRLMLVVPALCSEIGEAAFARIVDALRDHPFADPVVVSMNRMDAAGFARARAFLAPLAPGHRILWNDGPRLRRVREAVERAHPGTIPDGKGTNVWMAVGYALARGDIAAMAAHDADLVGYRRELLARLCTPVLDPEMGHRFAKAYYARVSDRMYGRVTRLLVFPLIRALRETLGPLPLLDFLGAFRYPLAGEFALSVDLAGRLRLPGHWGLETGMLCEVFRHAPPESVCQVGLGSGFEHRHRALDSQPSDAVPEAALAGMAQDIVRTLLAALGEHGVAFNAATLAEVGAAYKRAAALAIRRYADDARMNGLAFDADGEMAAAARFAGVLALAAEDILAHVPADPALPPWHAVFSGSPELRSHLLEAVETDNA